MNTNKNFAKLVLPGFLENINATKMVFPKIHYYIFENLNKNDNKLICPICYKAINKYCKIDCCIHRFCSSCINKWAKRKRQSPICRRDFKYIKFEN
jgi:hypothetical protein